MLLGIKIQGIQSPDEVGGGEGRETLLLVLTHLSLPLGCIPSWSWASTSPLAATLQPSLPLECLCPMNPFSLELYAFSSLSSSSFPCPSPRPDHCLPQRSGTPTRPLMWITFPASCLCMSLPGGGGCISSPRKDVVGLFSTPAVQWTVEFPSSSRGI